MADDVTMREAPEAERYEILVGGEVAGYTEYRGRAAVRAFTHTEVAEGHEGRGVASQIVQFALDDARSRGLQVVPVCPFIADYLARHPRELDLVAPELRRAFNLPEPPT